MDGRNFYITTPIYYVNDIPHIGHAYTTIACDVMSRYKRMKGYDVHFLTGTDEHGQKIQTAAEAKGMTPQELVDKIHVNFKELWKVLDIGNDDFIRTTEPRHVRVVQAMFKKLMDQGDIYKGTYEGQYCVPCETYVPESSAGEGNTCPDCGRPLTLMQEESYFFRASKYVPQLIAHYEKHLNGVMPRVRYNEIMSFLRGEVRDQSVSRTTLKWGIPIPGDEKHVIYVWFDALINYATASGYLDDPAMFRKYWPSVRHVVGKDIIRFHCVVWPLMLLALGLEPPVSVVAHGWWTVDGEKMSKSKGNVVDPFKMVELYGADAFRYFLLREVPFGHDGDFSEAALVGRINSDLANDLGNLLNRTLQMIVSYRDGVVPAAGLDDPLDRELRALAETTLGRVDEAMERFAFDDALKAIWALIGRANKYIDETMPWKLAKEGPSERLDSVLSSLYEALRLSALLVAPYMPGTSRRIWDQLGLEGTPLERVYDDFAWGEGSGAVVRKAEVLFPRIDLEAWKKVRAGELPKAGKAEAASPGEMEHEPEIGIEAFRAVEMRVAQIVKVEEIPKSRKLYKLEVDLGYEKRTVCSGIKAFFKPEELEGRRVVLVTNLKPAKLCGIESNGMILAASVKVDGNSEALTLVVPAGEIPLGSRVS
ncbi:methionine--tRNA ligase [Fretibacterium sp. OH1220_COT-178]|uniref:methionine--tRNA ligase n=1 Tax=Fretibacterium sp. OH1220_COT-178 TaxID=2491047 RepID=UPI000F5F0C5C|nr:methionine--tRNA ligase [Fretibacterium sp. OH1220_COT-178]RRD65702.1 methionine--tRNA ligase [Fretibacterium sp. OH1220_COT-178]